jgi:ABC-type bacteriocin/lantibiotic exporter with double-glycine peptidase domain
MAVLLAALAAAGQGCSAAPPSTLAADPDWMAVAEVPLRLQKGEADCGAAALAMVLARWGRSEEACGPLARQAEGTDGLRAGTLRDVARGEDLEAFVLRGTVEDLENELSAGHPVIVGLVRGQGPRRLNHYEVVAGLNPAGAQVLLADPARGWHRVGRDQFLKEWGEAGRVTVVVSRGYP